MKNKILKEKINDFQNKKIIFCCLMKAKMNQWILCKILKNNQNKIFNNLYKKMKNLKVIKYFLFYFIRINNNNRIKS